MSTSRNTLDLWRMDDSSYDPRGTTVAHMFGLCESLCVLGYENDIPVELCYRPGPLLSYEDVADTFPDAEYLADLESGTLTVSEAIRALRLLNRYLAFLPSEDD